MKIIITDQLREVLKNVNNGLSHFILNGDIPDAELANPDRYINYLDLSHTDKGHLSYLNKDRIEKIEQTEEKDYWRPGMRYHGRPGSVLKKLFNESHRRYMEDFSIKFISIVDKPDFHFEIVKGEDIAKFYDYKNYREQTGNLGGSCMARCQPDVFDFYVNNEKSINMLVMLDQHNKVMGRSIIWNGKDFKVMDRIYVCNDLYTGYFTDWAKKNNVFYKEHNNYRTPMHIIDPVSGDKIFKKFSIDLEETIFGKYPYLDSFKWLDKLNKKVYNYVPSDIKPNLGFGAEGIRVIADAGGGILMEIYMNLMN